MSVSPVSKSPESSSSRPVSSFVQHLYRRPDREKIFFITTSNQHQYDRPHWTLPRKMQTDGHRKHPSVYVCNGELFCDELCPTEAVATSGQVICVSRSRKSIFFSFSSVCDLTVVESTIGITGNVKTTPLVC